MAIPAHDGRELARRITDTPAPRPERVLTWRQKWTQDEIQTQLAELDGTASVTMQAHRAQGEIGKSYDRVLRDALEVIGEDLDDAVAKHLDGDAVGTAPSGTRRELRFTGTKDIPAILAVAAENNIDNLVNGLASVQQVSNLQIGKVVNRNRTAPEEPLPQPPVVVRRGLFGRLRELEG